jgi:hypothetical protein
MPIIPPHESPRLALCAPLFHNGIVMSALRFARSARLAVTAFVVLVMAQSVVVADEAKSQGEISPVTATAPLDAAGPNADPPLAGLAALPSVRSIRFTQRETHVGDRVTQRLGMQFEMTTTIVQSGQIAHDSTSMIRRQQQRTIEVLEAADGRAVKAQASFEICRRQSPDNADPNELVSLPVDGKSYLIVRDGDELRVTDLDGAMPPLEEYKLAVESLDGVGKPNPLAVVLAGREVAVGQRLFVPRDMAQALLGLGAPELAAVHRFELTLLRVATPAEPNAAELAVFRANIEVKPDDHSALAVNLNGEIAVEPATCRLVSVDLAGPVRVSTIERTAGGIYQFSMSGKLQVAIRAQFSSDAR